MLNIQQIRFASESSASSIYLTFTRALIITTSSPCWAPQQKLVWNLEPPQLKPGRPNSLYHTILYTENLQTINCVQKYLQSGLLLADYPAMSFFFVC